ncbi:MAG TPA: hypothetical protein VFK06_24965, partial [Candidatus Angelobacter sp.]|nr:hypothetical protein [Candidatus Angelobacter sp.]
MGILHSGHGMLDTRTLRNYGDGGKRVGSSQVTAVVERAPYDDQYPFHYGQLVDFPEVHDIGEVWCAA